MLGWCPSSPWLEESCPVPWGSVSSLVSCVPLALPTRQQEVSGRLQSRSDCSYL